MTTGRRGLPLAAIGISVVLWSTAFALSDIVLQTGSPAVLSVARFLIALVVLAPGVSATEDELIAHCRDRLTHFKCPTRIEFRDVLARTATGKLQKFKMRAPYWEGCERQVN